MDNFIIVRNFKNDNLNIMLKDEYQSNIYINTKQSHQKIHSKKLNN